MANPQQPSYPGFQPYVTTAPSPYPQQPLMSPYSQQQAYGQPYGQPYPQQPPPAYPQEQMMYGNPPYAPQPMPHAQFSETPAYATDEHTAEEGKDATALWHGFSDKAIRQAFIRKVYAILLVQLTFSLGVIALFVFEERVKFFVRRNSILYYISYAIFLGVYIALACCGNLRRKWPANVILLSIFTITMSYMLGTISSFHDTNIVLMAVGICASCCLAVSLFSFHTKFDFTSCGGVLFILVWVLFMFGIIAIFTYNDIVRTVYAACGALLFILFLAYDTQMIMGGKKHQLSAEEHIFAAMSLYLDVVYIFLFTLMLLGSGKK